MSGPKQQSSEIVTYVVVLLVGLAAFLYFVQWKTNRNLECRIACHPAGYTHNGGCLCLPDDSKPYRPDPTKMRFQ